MAIAERVSAPKPQFWTINNKQKTIVAPKPRSHSPTKNCSTSTSTTVATTGVGPAADEDVLDQKKNDENPDRDRMSSSALCPLSPPEGNELRHGLSSCHHMKTALTVGAPIFPDRWWKFGCEGPLSRLSFDPRVGHASVVAEEDIVQDRIIGATLARGGGPEMGCRA